MARMRAARFIAIFGENPLKDGELLAKPGRDMRHDHHADGKKQNALQDREEGQYTEDQNAWRL